MYVPSHQRHVGKVPQDHDVTGLALRTLEDALAEAEHGPVRRQWWHRLAITYLLDVGIAEPWQCAAFWKVMAEPPTDKIPDHSRYIRTTRMTGTLDNWYRQAGIKAPCMVTRGRWKRAAKPLIDSADPDSELGRVCNRYQPGERQAITSLFSAQELRQFNAGPDTVHPKDPGWIVRLQDGERVLEQMTWGFPVTLIGKKGLPLKPKPVNNARFDKLGTFWRRWATDPRHRCLISAVRFAEAVGDRGRMTETWLSLKAQPVFAWAGLWRRSDEWGDCYTGVMTDNALPFAHIHDRCPVILEPEHWHTWLTAPLAELYTFDRPYPAERMTEDATTKLWAAG